MYRTNSLDRSGSVSSAIPPLSPTDSCVSISSFRPSLVWLFNHIRREGRENLSKEDLRQLLGASVDNAQLNEAFLHLDLDGDGEISLDEFLGGFARFWKEAPHTPGYEKLRFSFPSHPTPSSSMTDGGERGGRIEERYEGEGGENHYHDDEEEPSDEFKRSLIQLSSHNRHSIETLWKSLRDANPELLVDFEDFVSEIAEEVQGAQRALDKQRRATRKEVRELEELVESELKDARTTLNIQTAQIKQQVQSKLEQRLVEKETELLLVRGQLDELESEVAETLKEHAELEQQCQELDKEKRELRERLELSEKQLLTQQSEVETQALKEVDEQRERLQKHETDLLQQKKEYEEEIAKLKSQLEQYSKHGTFEVDDPGDGDPPSEAPPDLLANTRRHKPSRDSLMAEIMQKEGKASPLLRREHLLEPSPFQHARSGSFVARRKKPSSSQTNLTSQAALTMSLPNLADADALERMPVANRNSVFIPVYVNELKHDNGSEEDDRHHDDSGAESEAESDHVTREPEADDIIVRGGAESPPLPRDEESDIGSTVSNPLEDSEYIHRCKPIEFIESLAIQPDYVFKILVVGNSYVGKSSFLMRLCTNAFSQRYASTIGVDFYSKALEIDSKIISLQLWDTAGQERFQSVTKAYYRGAQGIVLVYDISQEESFISVKSWISTIQENVEEMPGAMMLVGNKVDLEESSEREVSTETGETFAKIYGAEFIETSAKTGYNVGTALLMLVRSIKSYYESRGSNAINSEYKKTVDLAEQESSGSKCCGR